MRISSSGVQARLSSSSSGQIGHSWMTEPTFEQAKGDAVVLGEHDAPPSLPATGPLVLKVQGDGVDARHTLEEVA